MGRPSCGVCVEAQSKYKCPTCFMPYCSLACFKNHREVPCTKPDLPEQKPETHLLSARSIRVDEESWVLQKDQFESIASSYEIRNTLKNDELCRIISNINSSTNAEDELDKALRDPAFREFSDKISCILNPGEQSEVIES
ncbi:zinc finger HIT domain-containing protein 3 isoform X2 [Amborella trichopoda]|uniref:HIT-type domain-containing protein n=1 Tax=Amborella trichopoda TaxID=13333 RepID=U5CRE2_AMBTC|nr:zinc finger HIT domain-containing protein 3 isoform X2 [Amborella trichopoda]ERN15786.1 hypothetical protein AMTR_s00039p00115710 [Amborella trichopoda]|eukprot:XP_006854319.1 zinc finger HIT domain-containing protein 3 isoform X2 [Amborella trichopoda]